MGNFEVATGKQRGASGGTAEANVTASPRLCHVSACLRSLNLSFPNFARRSDKTSDLHDSRTNSLALLWYALGRTLRYLLMTYQTL